jgi:hypothetical protein
MPLGTALERQVPLYQEGQLDSLVREAGLKQIEARPIEVTTVFQNFDD